nr:MAG TPA: hypothetical protein [Bacteriophage sp.]
MPLGGLDLKHGQQVQVLLKEKIALVKLKE